jgi:hypothetical protein
MTIQNGSAIHGTKQSQPVIEWAEWATVSQWLLDVPDEKGQVRRVKTTVSAVPSSEIAM